MNITLNPFGQWHRVATIEVSSLVKDLLLLVRDDMLDFRLVETDSPHRSVRRYNLVVDSAAGERRCARTAWAVLSALGNAATHGRLDRYRVIDGGHWLTLNADAHLRNSNVEEARA
jgi:hypothetical protein